MDSSGGANHFLRGKLCEPSLEHHEELPVHGCQPAALQTGTNSCLHLSECACVNVCVTNTTAQCRCSAASKMDLTIEKLKNSERL